mgnify:FL=1|tara:strand:+ start:4469 stop:4906 length:438 start_codon:yes stop_codon:yes gene_type:complete
MRSLANNFYLVILSVSLNNCSVSPTPSPGSDHVTSLTWRTVQSEIRIGMTQAEILEKLGAPTIHTKNSIDEEVWTFEKPRIVSNETASANYGQHALVQGFLTLLFGGKFSSVSSTNTKEMKSLTIIITFNENKKVKDFSYQTLKL